MLSTRNNGHREWFLAALFIFGILLAGSDGEWFPIPNVVGVTLIGFCCFWHKKKVEDSKAREMSWKGKRICFVKPAHCPARPEPENALGLWRGCQEAEGDLRTILWAGSNAGEETRQVAL